MCNLVNMDQKIIKECFRHLGDFVSRRTEEQTCIESKDVVVTVDVDTELPEPWLGNQGQMVCNPLEVSQTKQVVELRTLVAHTALTWLAALAIPSFVHFLALFIFPNNPLSAFNFRTHTDI